MTLYDLNLNASSFIGVFRGFELDEISEFLNQHYVLQRGRRVLEILRRYEVRMLNQGDEYIVVNRQNMPLQCEVDLSNADLIPQFDWA